MEKASGKLVHCIRSLMFSFTPEELRKPYEERGLVFKEFSLSGEVHHISLNSSISIVRTDSQNSCVGGLIAYHLNAECSTSNYVYNDRRNLAYGEVYVPREVYEEISNAVNPDWVSVIRSGNIDATCEFYKQTGEWNKEKHGNGPVHYSLENNGNIFEIYPPRKDKDVVMEYIVMKSSSSLSNLQVEDIQGRQIKFI